MTPTSDGAGEAMATRHALIDEIQAYFAGPDTFDPKIRSVFASAAVRANSVADSGKPSPELAALIFVADALSGLAIERGLARDETAELLERVSEVLELRPDHVESAVFLRAIRDPRLVVLPAKLAVEMHLRLLVTLTPVKEASLWVRETRGPRALLHLGEGEPTRRMRTIAREALKRATPVASERAYVYGVPVLRWDRPTAALVLRVRPDDWERCVAFALEAAAVIGIVLERESLLERSMSRERSLVEAGERRLVRLGFDIHDGPIQDISALAGDLHHFRRQLGGVLPGEAREPLLGRVDDLEARLVEVDRELRELAQSLESPTILRRPLEDVLRREVESFGASNEIAATLDLSGNFAALTASQRIALVRVVQEALTNVREHSGASEVHVSVSEQRGFVQAAITDNGHGFDVEKALLRAARAGRLGLVGMSERVRLLGGTFDLQSRPGGPTAVSLTLPEWRPLAAEDLSERADPAR